MSIRKDLTELLNELCRGRVESTVAKEIGISVGRMHEYREGFAVPGMGNLQKIVNYSGKAFVINPEVFRGSR